MTCSSCNGPTASDAASVHWCVLCGANVTLQQERIDGLMTSATISVNGNIVYPTSYATAAALLTDTAEYKPLMAEELSQ